jgi:hypothetical protein
MIHLPIFIAHAAPWRGLFLAVLPITEGNNHSAVHLENENAEDFFCGKRCHTSLCNERDGAVGGHEGMRR